MYAKFFNPFVIFSLFINLLSYGLQCHYVNLMYPCFSLFWAIQQKRSGE